MKTLLAVVMLGLVGCSANAADGETSTASDETSTTLMCLSPSDHPFNGNAPIWTVSADTVMQTTAFYWHGTPILTDGATGPTWKITSHDGNNVQAINDAGDAIAIALVSNDPKFPTLLTGTLDESGAPEVTITRGTSCMTMPGPAPQL